MKSFKSKIINLLLFIITNLNSFNAYYSTKTAYLDSFTSDQFNYLNNSQNYLINNCVHGARFPSKKQVEKSKNFIEHVRNYLKQKSDVNFASKQLLDSLTVTFDDKPYHGLSLLGGDEMFDIGKRFMNRYPSLFDKAAIENSIQNLDPYISIVSSEKERCVDSAKSFLNGLLFDNKDYFNDPNYKRISKLISDRIVINNQMLRLFALCKKYLVTVESNHTATSDLHAFKYGEHMNEVVRRFKKRHEIEDIELIDSSLLIKLFTLCNIEYAHRMDENWCKLFDKDEYISLSYYNDLKAYWKKSYGYKINSQMVFLLIQDLFNQMEKHINGEPNASKVLLRFGHAENMLPLITALGIYRDENILRHDNLNENLNRKFKCADITPFSANLAFVLHQCNSEKPNSGNKYDDYKINVLMNELPIPRLKNAGEFACGNKDHSLCNYLDLKAHLNDYINLDEDEVCRLDNENSGYKNEL